MKVQDVITDVNYIDKLRWIKIVFIENVLNDKLWLVLAADHDASEAGEEEDKENKAEAVEVHNLDVFFFFCKNS